MSRKIWSLGACLIAAGCSSAPKPHRGVQRAFLPVIDAHTHTDFDGKPEATSKISFTLEEYLREMKEAGVVGAVAHTQEYDQGYANLQQYGVIHCAGIRERVDAGVLEEGLKSGRYGCIKIYLGYTYHFASDPLYAPVYQLAERYDVAVIFHTGDTYSTQGKLKYADPLTIDEVAVDHPKVRFVIAHCGNPWIESAAEVAYKNPNVYLDGSALLIGDLNTMDPKVVQEYMIRPLAWIFGYVEDPGKLMFATDWPLVNMSIYLDAFKQAIPREHWNAVFHDNAARVFKFRN